MNEILRVLPSLLCLTKIMLTIVNKVEARGVVAKTVAISHVRQDNGQV